MISKPSIPKGTRDFSPLQMRRRNYIFETIKKVFQAHAFLPIETPSMENMSTLMGKYGEEGDKLLFKILNSGNYLSFLDEEHAASMLSQPLETEKLSKTFLKNISEKGLRYDLTVPFARFVVQHQNELQFPFKRYQIQPVWRADRPQKGRYREFYQCDVDIIGSDSLQNEAELVEIIEEVYQAFGIPVEVKINNRKLLFGIAQVLGYEDMMMDITIAIDKIDKVGLEGVKKELVERGIATEAVEKLTPILTLSGNFDTKIGVIRQFLSGNEVGMKGVEEIEELFSLLKEMQIQMPCTLDLTLARGLNYYTGAIFEVKALGVEMGSINGGGRYDDLTGHFGLKNMSGVGVSFGADRIYDVLNELQLFPAKTESGTDILFINFGREDAVFVYPLLKQLRKNGASVELYPQKVKIQKQFTYADKLNIPYVAMVGESERQEHKITLKNLKTGEQRMYSLEEIIELINHIKNK